MMMWRRSPKTKLVRLEQAVYGSFAFWDKGYGVLARSPGCRDAWLTDLRAACQRNGEPPASLTASTRAGVIATRLPSGPWAIIGAFPLGRDDLGRRGAFAFHALFLTPRDYRRLGASPFALAEMLRGDWTIEAATTALASLHLPVRVAAARPKPAEDPSAARIVANLIRGRRVAIEARAPIDGLAEEVWRALPLRRRVRLSLATWTFADLDRHDLAALPKLATPTDLEDLATPQAEPHRGLAFLGRAFWPGLALATLGGLGLAIVHASTASRPIPSQPDHGEPAILRDATAGVR